MTVAKEVIYPQSDGQPMADNTKQFNYIVLIKEGLEALFRHDPNIFVAGDFLWYPVEGNNKLRVAPDAMVVFGRPKGDRGSYLQWLEENIPPQVVFEVLSPGNTKAEMRNKKAWYELYGVQEYYVYDPDRLILEGYLRQGEQLEPIASSSMRGWVSPRLQVRFEMEPELNLYGPDGRRFTSYTQTIERAERAELRVRQEEEQRQQAEFEATRERQTAERERQTAERERQRAERLAAKLKELGYSPDEEG